MNAVDQTDDRYAIFGRDSDRHDSRSTLDAAAHWDWRNPLIVLPLGILLAVIVGVALTLWPSVRALLAQSVR